MSTTSDELDRVESESRRPDGAVRRVPGEPGAWIFILGEMVVFAVLFGLYLFNRIEAPEVFRDAKQHLDLALGTVNTLLLLVSSLLVVGGVRAARARDTLVAPRLLAGAALCGLGFTAIKYVEYSHHVDQGFTMSANAFWTYYFILTGTHLLHLLIGLAVLWFMIVQARKPVLDGEHRAYLEGGACYWHMVDFIWLILFPLLYLMT